MAGQSVERQQAAKQNGQAAKEKPRDSPSEAGEGGTGSTVSSSSSGKGRVLEWSIERVDVGARGKKKTLIRDIGESVLVACWRSGILRRGEGACDMSCRGAGKPLHYQTVTWCSPTAVIAWRCLQSVRPRRAS